MQINIVPVNSPSAGNADIGVRAAPSFDACSLSDLGVRAAPAFDPGPSQEWPVEAAKCIVPAIANRLAPESIIWNETTFKSGAETNHVLQGFNLDIVENTLEQLRRSTEKQIELALANHHAQLLSQMRVLVKSHRVEEESLSSKVLNERCPVSPGKNLREEMQHVTKSSVKSNKSKDLRTGATMETISSLEEEGRDHFASPSQRTDVTDFTGTLSEKYKGHSVFSNEAGKGQGSSDSIMPGPHRFFTSARRTINFFQQPRDERMLSLALGPSSSMTEVRKTIRQSTLRFSQEKARPKRDSRLHDFLHSPGFELSMGIAVFVNAILIGCEVQYMAMNPEQLSAPLVFTTFSYLFTLMFVVELIFRLVDDWWRFIWYSDAKTLTWNYMDICIVASSLAEVYLDIATFHGSSSGQYDVSNVRIIRIVRVFRLMRLLRVARFVRFVRALRTLVYSILCTLRSVFWAFVLLTTIMYVYAILFTQAATSHRSLYTDSREIPGLYRYWGTISNSMTSLFMSIAGGVSWEDVIDPLWKLGLIYWFIFIVYIFFTYFAVLNVVTGVFCQAAIEGNSEDHDSMLQTVRRHKQMYTRRFVEIFQEIDKNGSGKIRLQDFESRMDDEAVKDYFASLDLTCGDALCLFDVFDDETSEGVQIEEFVMGCLRLKGTARSSDMVKLLHENRQILGLVERICKFVHHAESQFHGSGNGSMPSTPKVKLKSSAFESSFTTPRSSYLT